jgi:hypothetical protein
LTIQLDQPMDICHAQTHAVLQRRLDAGLSRSDPTDRIIGGGRYVRIQKRGHEVCNFVDAGGFMFGYVQPVGSHIKLEKLGASKDADQLEGVDVVITAHRPRGDTVIVGGYRDATVYRDLQPLAMPTALHKKNGVCGFRFTSLVEDVKLLSPDDRSEVVPRGKGGMGQSNVWYAENASKAWITRVRQLLDGTKTFGPSKRKRLPPDVFKNAQVEDAAMNLAWAHYEARGYDLKDVSKANRGWDLEATSGKLTLRIEVKGLSGKVASIELTPNEYKALLKNALDYRLCIITDALASPVLDICAFNLVSGVWTVEAGSIRSSVTIKERTAAQVTLN